MTADVVRNLRGAGAALRAHPAFRSDPIRVTARALSWPLVCLTRRDAVVRLDGGATLSVPPRLLRSGSGAIYVFRDDYEIELRHLGRLVASGMTFVDGGANIGAYAAVAAQLVGPSGRVLAIEPAAVAFRQLARNAGRATFGNVTVENAALSDAGGEARLFHVNGGPVGYSLGALAGFGDVSETVRTVTLDELVQRLGLERVDVVKLDVEGAEEMALRGASDTLARFAPTVLFEYNLGAPVPDGRAHVEAWHRLRDLGYELFVMAPDGALTPVDEPVTGNNVARRRPARR